MAGIKVTNDANKDLYRIVHFHFRGENEGLPGKVNFDWIFLFHMESLISHSMSAIR